ncbi:MAG: glutathione ABC transporter substrate-binding protein [Tissierellia bacterium]|nr:glutathione ABC transporter substrate-binding protein [Tissierellia bacterium]
MKRFKKLSLILALIMSFTLFITACGGNDANDEKTDTAETVEKDQNEDKADGKDDSEKDSADSVSGDYEIVVAQGADPKSLDPHGSNDQPSSRVNKQIYDTMVEQNANMELVPGLAESWEQIDEKTWEFKLREDVKFHNGEDLKASDVVFSLLREKESPNTGHIVGFIDDVEAKDDYTVVIKLAEPFAPILSHLAHTASSILNEKAVTEAGEDYVSSPIGTGPFKFVSHDSGDKVTLEAFEDYYQGPAKFKTLVFKNVQENATRTIGLETGEIDIAYDIEPNDFEVVKGNDDLELIEDASLSTAYIGFNTQKEPFTNSKVRKALNHAVNVDEIIEVILEGSGEPATGPINSKVFGYDDDLEVYEYDVEKAKSLLKEAGFADGFTTTIWTNDNDTRVKIAELVQAQLAEVGVQAEIEIVEWGAYLDRTAAGEHDMFILGWVTVTGDADYGLYALFHSTQKGAAGNRTFFENSEVDKLLDAGRKESDPDKRLEVYKEAQEIIVDEAPELFLYFQNQNAGVQKSISGFELHPAGHHRLYTVEKDQ